MQLTIESHTGLRRAIVTVSDDGVIVTHYLRATHVSKWAFDRSCAPTAPFHVVLDQVTSIVNAQPRPDGGQL